MAEDAEDDLERLVLALGQAGYVVEGARDGTELFERLDGLAPSLVVLEVDLPSLGGVEACRAIRSRSDASILVVSAHDPHSDLSSTLEVGADAYLERVDRVRELVARVRALLRRQATAAGSDGRDIPLTGSA